MKLILTKNTAQLSTLLQLLNLLSDVQYTQPLKELKCSTIGKHVRHIIEFYLQLLTNENFISYDARNRDLNLENFTSSASERIISILDTLSQITEDKNLSLDCSITLGENQTINTFLSRELLYTLDHTIHHLAIIKIGLEFSLQIKIADHIGVAPSTLQHIKNTCAQ